MSAKKLPEGLQGQVDDGDSERFKPVHTSLKADGMSENLSEHKAATESQSDANAFQSVRFRGVSAAERRGQYLRLAFLGLLIVLGFGLGGGYLLMETSPAARNWAQKRIKKLEAFAEQHNGAIPTFSLEALERKVLSWYGPGSEQAALRPWKEMDCRFLIQEALSRKLNKALDAEGRYLLVACQLSQDMPAVALQHANEVFEAKAGSKEIQRNWNNLNEKLITDEAKFRSRALEVQAPRQIQTCRTWAPSPDCLIRLVDEARNPLSMRQDKALQVFDKNLKQLVPHLKIWFFWAAAQNAIKTGRSAEAENRLREASELLKGSFDPFLERAVFKSRVQNAWLRRDLGMMQKIWKERPKQRMSDDALSFLDVELMYKDLIDPSQGLEQLDAFLNQPESYLRFRYDPLFVRWVVEQAISKGRASSGRLYLERLTQVEDSGEKATPSEWLENLWIRLDLAEGKGIAALKALQKRELYAEKSALLYHLKGLAMLQGFSSREYRLRAAQEFQKAVNIDGNPESFFAIIVTFLEADALKKAEATLSFWQKQKLNEASKPWLEMARGLVQSRAGKNVEGRKLFFDTKQRYPDFQPLRKLEQKLNGDKQYLETQLLTNMQLMLGAYGPLGPLVFLGQKS